MPNYENSKVEKEERVVIITLNRPQRLNALSEGLQRELVSVIEELEKDDNVGVAIITGAPRPDGRPCFSAGADIKEMQEMGVTDTQKLRGSLEEGLFKTFWAFGESRDQWQNAWNRVQQFTKPLIAAIDGICTAGGLELAMVCDMRYVSETADIRDLHMKNLGILGGGGLQTWLPRLVGIGKAKDIAWTGDPLNGKEAVQIGLAQRVFPPDKLLSETKRIAKSISSSSTTALRLSKVVMNASLNQGIYESLRFSAFAEALSRFLKSGDQAEFKKFVETGK